MPRRNGPDPDAPLPPQASPELTPAIRKRSRSAVEELPANGIRIAILRADGRLAASGEAAAATVTRTNLGIDIRLPLTEGSLLLTLGHAATKALAGALSEAYRRNHPLAAVDLSDRGWRLEARKPAATHTENRATGATRPAARR